MHEHPTRPAADEAGSGTDPDGQHGLKDSGTADVPAGGKRRKAALAGAATAVLVLACAGGVVAAGSLLPNAASSRSVQPAAAAVPAGTSVGVCPGPARLLEGTEAGTDPQFSPESDTAATSVTGAVLGTAGVVPGSRLSQLGGAAAVEIAKAPGAAASEGPRQELLAGTVSGRTVDSVSVLSADAVANQKASAAGAMVFRATDGDLQGSAAANCLQPSNDQWLAGASTTVGRTSVLVLSNASSSPATVSLELFGGKGQIQAPGSRGLLVAPGTTRSVVLAGLAPGEEQLSVRVRSTGGPIAAAIQQSVLRGLTPGGVDFITPGTAPAVRQVMTGVDIQDAAGIAALTSKPGYADAAPALEITVPGPSDAVVEVKLHGRDGQKALPSGGVITAKANSITEVSLAGVPAGNYTVAASSDVSFVAATRITRGLQVNQPSDVAWAASGIRLGSQHVVAVPRGGTRQLVFGALDTRATITYAAITADGKVKAPATADIAGGTTASITVPNEADGAEVVGYVVSASGDAAYGAVLVTQDGRSDVSSLPFQAAAAGQETVPVALGY
ncbi:conserved hypothetical protein [Pseudarthrobacter chlorophenolicus A6]|uniref:Secreted protein n=1 Tax=Pseudarthrobacter chlorophenolicus (strain ATCC 700700 / DSM 12829 / CIP 107037 / JCM 12360 / KCTC 9906 / NCIMB 13794 / A6) TaxID=452863 RepID=B8HEZ0_PSECP|nr:DUF5719 family protein [Pseudarthrobacter chlorophenolicus]ACL39256.1 conserved hypothetical protein [Pseudarthrobacter chlorophenolicus A6]SDR02093.1 hypothetical protein SAMN04489738_4259 [Pseudarthrobacter chlorophenolicus]